MAIVRYGSPTASDIFLFLTGALGGYGVFSLSILSQTLSIAHFIPIAIPVAATANIFALLSAIAVSFITRQIRDKRLGYLATGFSATVVYVLSLATLFYVFG